MNFLAHITVIGLSISCALACLGRTSNGGSSDTGNGKGNNGNGNGNGGNGNGVLDSLGLGNDDIQPYDSGDFENQNGPVDDPSDLNCDFEGDCCWGNEQSPTDQFEWVKATKTPSESAMEALFDTDITPQGDYLLTAVAGGDSASEARFVSCSIGCAEGDITVVLEHWQTSNAKLEVCTQTTFPGEDPTLLNCAEIPRDRAPGPTPVTLAGGENLDIVIVASNLVGDRGDGVIIDNLEVDFRPCDESQPPPDRQQPPPSGGGDECSAQCGFEQNAPCGYTDSSLVSGSSGSNLQTFEVVRGQYKNRVTGVPGASPNSGGDGYAVAYLFPGEVAGLETDISGGLGQDRVLQFDHYEATYGMSEKVCFDSANNCPFSTDELASSGDRAWKTSSVVIPEGTEKLIIAAENNGKNQGAAAIDNIRILATGSGGGVNGASEFC